MEERKTDYLIRLTVLGMRATVIAVSFVALFGVTFFAAPLNAEESPRASLDLNPADVKCESILRDCMVVNGQQRTDCLLSSSKSIPCIGSPLGQLAIKRWSFSPEPVPSSDETFSFLGPQIVDQDCILGFDTQLSSALLSTEVSEKVIADLTEGLTKCRKDTSNDIMRP